MSLIAPGIYFPSNFTLLIFHIPQPISHLRHFFSPTVKLIETSGETVLLFFFITISIKAIPSFQSINASRLI